MRCAPTFIPHSQTSPAVTLIHPPSTNASPLPKVSLNLNKFTAFSSNPNISVLSSPTYSPACFPFHLTITSTHATCSTKYPTLLITSLGTLSFAIMFTITISPNPCPCMPECRRQAFWNPNSPSHRCSQPPLVCLRYI